MVDGVTSAAIAHWVWDNADLVKKRTQALYEWITDSRLKPILIIGPGGVGKTTLAGLLGGKYNLLAAPSHEYVQSLGIEIVKTSAVSKSKLEIVVAPGQKQRRDSTWPDLESKIVNGNFRGIVHLACYGHHSLGISWKDHPQLGKCKRVAEFLEKFVTAQQADEVDTLKRLVPAIKSAPGKIWLLTLVTKQDLWWSDKPSVEQHYRHGDFGMVVSELVQQHDCRRFRHEEAYASLVICNYKTTAGELLKQNCAGYDQPIQTASLRNIFETISSLKEWEEQK